MLIQKKFFFFFLSTLTAKSLINKGMWAFSCTEEEGNGNREVRLSQEGNAGNHCVPEHICVFGAFCELQGVFLSTAGIPKKQQDRDQKYF